MNPQDVHTVFKDKFENLVKQLNQLGDKEAGELSRAKLCPLKDLGYHVGEMCEQKSIIFAKLGNRIMSDQWIDVGLYLIRDYKICLSEMIKRNEQYNTPQYRAVASGG